MKLDELPWRAESPLQVWESVRLPDGNTLYRSVKPVARMAIDDAPVPVGTVALFAPELGLSRRLDPLTAECLAIEYLKSNPTK